MGKSIMIAEGTITEVEPSVRFDSEHNVVITGINGTLKLNLMGAIQLATDLLNVINIIVEHRN